MRSISIWRAVPNHEGVFVICKMEILINKNQYPGSGSKEVKASQLFQFGEPLGSFKYHRNRDRFGLHCCLAQIPGECGHHHDHHTARDNGEKCSEHKQGAMDRLDPGTVLNISVRKQQGCGVTDRREEDDLYRIVLIKNTAKAAQKEIRKNILQSLFFWTIINNTANRQYSLYSYGIYIFSYITTLDQY